MQHTGRLRQKAQKASGIKFYRRRKNSLLFTTAVDYSRRNIVPNNRSTLYCRESFIKTSLKSSSGRQCKSLDICKSSEDTTGRQTINDFQQQTTLSRSTERGPWQTGNHYIDIRHSFMIQQGPQTSSILIKDFYAGKFFLK